MLVLLPPGFTSLCPGTVVEVGSDRTVAVGVGSGRTTTLRQVHVTGAASAAADERNERNDIMSSSSVVAEQEEEEMEEGGGVCSLWCSL